MSIENIDSTLQEERLFQPSAEFVQAASINTAADLEALHRQAEEDYEGFWAKLGHAEISWQTPFTTTLDTSNAPHYQWFNDGRTNVSYNCLDRHLESRGNNTAIIFEGEKGDIKTLTYSELHAQVCCFANALKTQGISKGDRVVIYMPMTPEAVVAMQACARIGIVSAPQT